MGVSSTCEALAGNGHRILHVSGDFPDPINPAKTPVIRTLIDLTAGSFDHSVVSINRRTPSALATIRSLVSDTATAVPDRVEQFPYGVALSYQAPSRGVLHVRHLNRLGDWLAASAVERFRPELLVGHKLTIEGLAVARAAKRTGLPYALVIQGNTDETILKARPDLRGAFARVYHGASMVFPFTPWALQAVERRLGKRSGPVRLLPCPTDLDVPLPPRRGDGSIVSVFHLRNFKIKNLDGMIAAVRRLEASGKTPTLEIVGGGSEDDLAKCMALADGTDRVTFKGPLDREDVRARLNRASGFVMPSRKESFGLAFIEALFAGTPIIYPAGSAVDGYFDDASFALRVNARDPAAIAAAMRTVMEREAELKADLARWQQGEGPARFTREAIARQFAEGLNLAVTAR